MASVPNFKGFPKDKEASQTCGLDSKHFNLGMDEGNMQELPEAIPEEVTNELLEME